MNSILTPFLIGTALALLQGIAALPWLAALDWPGFKAAVRRSQNWLFAVGAIAFAGAAVALFINVVQDPDRLLVWGRLFGMVLSVQLLVDFFVIAFPLLLLVWPHGGSVALAAFREGTRQPMYWMIFAFGLGLLLISPVLPYFTFGEDVKMVRELGHDTIMLAGVLFAVLAASMSISEEIEGRTAITVMSKPVSRRQFLGGKFIGILLAAALMTGVLGEVFNGVIWFKQVFDKEEITQPYWFEAMRQAWMPALGEAPLHFTLGLAWWYQMLVSIAPGLVFGFCQVMVLLAIASALATRLPMVVNFVTCLLVFLLGHLTQLMVQVSAGKYALVNFVARVFQVILPGLDYFDLGPIIVRDIPPDPRNFAIYIGSVTLYAVMYSVIALLFGLILFEDRDLA
jgi:hypothetical protein